MADSAADDPLQLLRTTIQTKDAEIQMLNGAEASSPRVYTFHECSHLSFPVPSSSSSTRTILPKTTTTRFKRLPTSSATETWELQALLLCYLRKDATVGEYAPEAVREGVPLVGVMERRIVNDYLEGKDDGTGAAAAYLVSENTAPRPGVDVSVEGTLAQTAVAKSGEDGVLPALQGVTALADGDRPAKRARYVVNKEDLEAYKRIVSLYEVRQISDRATVLRGTGNKTANFASVREMIADRLKSGRDELKRAPTNSSAAAAAAAQAQSAITMQHRKRRQNNPIIVISPSSSALITMYNVKRFLEESIFETSDQARAVAGRTADDAIQISHKRQIGALAVDAAMNAAMMGLSGQQNAERAALGEKLVRYWVVDGVDALSRFGDDAWDRVVCVMTTGQEWQFRPYKWTEPKELFAHVKGVYPKWANEPSNPKIASWNVSELRVDPAKRHIDKSTVAEFWRSLEAWIHANKRGVVDF